MSDMYLFLCRCFWQEVVKFYFFFFYENHESKGFSGKLGFSFLSFIAQLFYGLFFNSIGLVGNVNMEIVHWHFGERMVVGPHMYELWLWLEDGDEWMNNAVLMLMEWWFCRIATYVSWTHAAEVDSGRPSFLSALSWYTLFLTNQLILSFYCWNTFFKLTW